MVPRPGSDQHGYAPPGRFPLHVDLPVEGNNQEVQHERRAQAARAPVHAGRSRTRGSLRQHAASHGRGRSRGAPKATICLTTALAHHGLVDAIPSQTDLALPRGQWYPAGECQIRWHSFDERTFEIGRTTAPIFGARHRIGLYSAERSLVDAFRLRSLIGYEVAVEALRAWLKRRGSSPAELVGIARQIPRSEGLIRQALSFLT